MVKVQQLPSGQLVITIPKKIAEYEGLTKGTELEFKKHDEGFLLKVKQSENESVKVRENENRRSSQTHA